MVNTLQSLWMFNDVVIFYLFRLFRSFVSRQFDVKCCQLLDNGEIFMELIFLLIAIAVVIASVLYFIVFIFSN